MHIYFWQILGCEQGLNPCVFHVIPLMFEGVGVRSSSVSLLNFLVSWRVLQVYQVLDAERNA